MKAIAKYAILSVTFAILAACAGTPINWNKARQVKEGMSEAEVIALMGNPYMVRSTGKGEQQWIWSFATGFGGAESMSLRLKDGKVIQVPDIPASFK